MILMHEKEGDIKEKDHEETKRKQNYTEQIDIKKKAYCLW